MKSFIVFAINLPVLFPEGPECLGEAEGGDELGLTFEDPFGYLADRHDLGFDVLVGSSSLIRPSFKVSLIILDAVSD